MTDDTVVALRPGYAVESDRKRQFMEQVGASFDHYVKDYDAEPEAIVYVLGGLKQSARCAYLMTGASEGGPTTMIGFAAAVLLVETRAQVE